MMVVVAVVKICGGGSDRNCSSRSGESVSSGVHSSTGTRSRSKGI